MKCCDICPRYTSCEEEGHLNNMCCISCPEYPSCHEDAKGKKDSDDLDGGFDEV